MKVAVLVPWRAGCDWRERSWAWVRARYEAAGLAVIAGTTDVDGFSRTQAILDARARSDADVFVIADADVFGDIADEPIDSTLAHGWAVPYNVLHRLSPESTMQVLGGADWHGLPLSTDNEQDRRPYRIHEAGTLLTITAAAFDIAPPDPRFVGWGQEDAAWATALRTLVGPPWRGDADLVHLWHPAEPRRTRVIGNNSNVALLRCYRAAAGNPAQMRQLIAEHATAAV